MWMMVAMMVMVTLTVDVQMWMLAAMTAMVTVTVDAQRIPQWINGNSLAAGDEKGTGHM